MSEIHLAYTAKMSQNISYDEKVDILLEYYHPKVRDIIHPLQIYQYIYGLADFDKQQIDTALKQHGQAVAYDELRDAIKRRNKKTVFPSFILVLINCQYGHLDIVKDGKKLMNEYKVSDTKQVHTRPNLLSVPSLNSTICLIWTFMTAITVLYFIPFAEKTDLNHSVTLKVEVLEPIKEEASLPNRHHSVLYSYTLSGQNTKAQFSSEVKVTFNGATGNSHMENNMQGQTTQVHNASKSYPKPLSDVETNNTTQNLDIQTRLRNNAEESVAAENESKDNNNNTIQRSESLLVATSIFR